MFGCHVNEFKATHEITLLAPDGTARTFEVQLAQGHAHTRTEWARGRPAEWTVRDGRWWFQDRAGPLGCVTLAITPIAVAALERLAWELVRGSPDVRYDGKHLAFSRDDARRALRLEVTEDHLRLTDGHRAFHVDVSASALWVRELVEDWLRAAF